MTNSNTIPTGYVVAEVMSINMTSSKYTSPFGEGGAYVVVPEILGDRLEGADNGAFYYKWKEDDGGLFAEPDNYTNSKVCPKCGQTYFPSGYDREEVVWYPIGDAFGKSPEEAIAKFEGGNLYLRHTHTIEYGSVADKDMPL